MAIWLGGDGFERYMAGLSTTETLTGFGIWVGLILLFAFATPVFLFASQLTASAGAKRILKNGVDAPATILSVTDTKTRINQNIVLDIQLRVTPPDKEPFTALVSKTVSITQINRFQPGSSVAVKYHPETLEAAIAD